MIIKKQQAAKSDPSELEKGDLMTILISDDLFKDKITTKSNKEIIALIAYLQRMGTDIKLEQKKVATNP